MIVDFKPLTNQKIIGTSKAITVLTKRNNLKGLMTMRLMRFQRPHVANWSPLDQFESLRNEINRLLETPAAGWSGTEEFNTWAPALDLYEDKDSLVVTAELPGLKKEDIDISLHEGNLTLAGERKVEKAHDEKNMQRAERFFGRFQRTISLPKAVDANNVKAAYKDGILTVTVPKAAEAKPRQIEVNAG